MFTSSGSWYNFKSNNSNDFKIHDIRKENHLTKGKILFYYLCNLSEIIVMFNMKNFIKKV